MGSTRSILAITGTRADYGLMTPIYTAIKDDPKLQLHVVVTGMHGEARYRESLQEIKTQSLGQLHYIKLPQYHFPLTSMSEGIGILIANLDHLLARIKPDLVLLQGDRGEMLAGAIAALYRNIPIFHMSGGDTSGTVDDSIRHAISKLAHVHLTTCASSSNHLIAMGENPSVIFEVGEPALDKIRTQTFLSKLKLEKQLKVSLPTPFIVVLQHPVVTEFDQATAHMTETMEAVLQSQYPALIFAPNSDLGRDEMKAVFHKYIHKKPFHFFDHLEYNLFLNLLKYAAVLVGNSSCGIIEAPSFRLPVVNIGTRQHGRLKVANVIDVDYDRTQIYQAIQTAIHDQAFRQPLKHLNNPYGDGHTAEKVVKLIKTLPLADKLVAKWLA